MVGFFVLTEDDALGEAIIDRMLENVSKFI